MHRHSERLSGAIILLAVLIIPRATTAQLPADWSSPGFELGTSNTEAAQAFAAAHAAWVERDWVAATELSAQAYAADPDFHLGRAFHASVVGGTRAAADIDRAITRARAAGEVEGLMLEALRQSTQDRTSAARTLVSAAARLAPGQTWLIADLYGRVERDPATSVALARELVARDPEAYRTHALLALSLTAPGDSVEALQEMGNALRLGGGEPFPHWVAGEVMARLGRYDDAVMHYGHALARDSLYYQARLDAAKVAMFTERYADARRELELALPHVFDKRHKGMIRRVIGLTYMYDGEIDTAQRLLAEAAAATEADGALQQASLTYRFLAQIAAVKGDSAGVAHYVALQERPGFTYTSLDYWSTLAWYFADEPVLARQYLEKHANEMKTGDTMFFQFALNIITGAVLSAEGQYEEALAVVEDESNLFAVVIGARALRALGRTDEADARMASVYHNGYGLDNWVTPLAHWKRHTGTSF